MSATVELLKVSAIEAIQEDLEAAVAASATAAATSATAAATSATAAATSATAAATSASSAASSATTALSAIITTFKGGVAGASVPAASTAAGDYYRITSAGTSQSKTWAVGDLAVYNGTSGSWTQIAGGVTDPTSLANAVNPRATQRELVWDGTTNARLQATLTGQNIATGDVVLVWKGRLNTEAAEQWLIATGPATSELMGGAGGFGILKTTAGHLQAGWQGSGGYEYRRVANAVTTYGDAEILVIAARSGSTLKVWINSVEIAHTAGDTTAPLLSSSVTSTFLAVNFRGSNYSTGYKGSFSRGWIGNFMPSQADVTEIQRNGGRVPDRYSWGQQSLNTQVGVGWQNSNMTTMTGTSNTGVSCTQSSGQGNIDAWFANLNAGFVARVGQSVRIRGTSTVNSGATPTFESPSGNSGFTPQSTALTAGSFDLTLTVNRSGLWRGTVRVASTSDFALSNLQFTPVGAFCYLDAENGGVGLQVPDPANKLHGLLISGGTWNGPITPTGFVRATSDGMTTAQPLGGGTILPANIQILRVRARALTGTPSITLGTLSGGSQIVASVALSTTWKNLTIALTDGIVTTASSLWMTASAANVVEVQVAYEQLPA